MRILNSNTPDAIETPSLVKKEDLKPSCSHLFKAGCSIWPKDDFWYFTFIFSKGQNNSTIASLVSVHKDYDNGKFYVSLNRWSDKPNFHFDLNENIIPKLEKEGFTQIQIVGAMKVTAEVLV